MNFFVKIYQGWVWWGVCWIEWKYLLCEEEDPGESWDFYHHLNFDYVDFLENP